MARKTKEEEKNEAFYIGIIVGVGSAVVFAALIAFLIAFGKSNELIKQGRFDVICEHVEQVSEVIEHDISKMCDNSDYSPNRR